MDNLVSERTDALRRWVRTRQLAVAHLSCLVAVFIARRRLQRVNCVNFPGRELQSESEEMSSDLSTTSGESVEMIDEVDQRSSTSEVMMEGFNNNKEGISTTAMSSTRKRHHNITTSMCKKRKYDDEDIMALKIVRSLEDVAEAIREGNTILRESNAMLERSRPRVYAEEEIYNELELMGLEQNVIRRAHPFLVKYPENARAVFGCPVPIRRSILEEAMRQDAS